MNTQDTMAMRRPMSKVEVTNAFLRSVYNWMALGLGLTAAISFLLTYTTFQALLFTQQGIMIGIGSIIAELVIVVYLSARIHKLSASTATTLFLVYSALNGISLSFVLIMYEVGSVAQAFLSATGMFAGMSIYGLYTKRDLTSVGNFCVMALIGLIIAMVVNMFIGSSMMNMLISVVGVFLFLGLTAYDTQLLKEMGESTPRNNPVAVHRATIMGALRLYLDFINLFIMMLRLMGDRR